MKNVLVNQPIIENSRGQWKNIETYWNHQPECIWIHQHFGMGSEATDFGVVNHESKYYQPSSNNLPTITPNLIIINHHLTIAKHQFTISLLSTYHDITMISPSFSTILHDFTLFSHGFIMISAGFFMFFQPGSLMFLGFHPCMGSCTHPGPRRLAAPSPPKVPWPIRRSPRPRRCATGCGPACPRHPGYPWGLVERALGGGPWGEGLDVFDAEEISVTMWSQRVMLQ